MSIKKIVKQLMWVSCVWFTTTSCIRENMSDCYPTNVTLSFSEAFAPPAKGVLSEEIHSLDVFIFDANGLCVKHKRDAGSPFDANYEMSFHLKPDTYDVVTWANLNNKDYELTGDAGSTLFEEGKSYYKEAMLHLKTTRGDISRNVANLYHGTTDPLTVEPYSQEIVRRNIPMVKDVNTFNIEFQFVGGVIQGGELQVEIDGLNGHMYFDNTIERTLSPIIYRPYIAREGLFFTAEVMRLRVGLPLVLRAINPLTGVTVLNEDLTTLILKTGDVKNNEDFDRVHTYNIVISFGANIETTIIINGWEVKTPDSDLG